MVSRKFIPYSAFLSIVLVLFATRTWAFQSADSLSVFEFLTPEEGVKLSLETDLTTIIAQKKSNTYFPGSLTTADGKAFKIELKPRGKYRRKVAEMPPLKMKFKKKELREMGLDTFNEIKLVLPCYDNALGDELIIKEYLAYRMYEHLTGASVRARLIKLAIRDTHVEKSKKSVYAILLEDNEETAARLNGTEVEEYGIPADSLIQNQAALVAMFEYMIGNTDWEIAMLRNVRLLKSPESDKILTIPYDFDFSGFVSAPYASPSSESGLRTVKDRYLMAGGIKTEALKRAVQQLQNAKEELFTICKSKHLSKSSANQLINYLEIFFQHVEGKEIIPQRINMSTD